MKLGGGRAALPIALIIFVIFFSNVAIGAAGIQPFLSDIGEAVTMGASVFFFVVGILQVEAAAKSGRH